MFTLNVKLQRLYKIKPFRFNTLDIKFEFSLNWMTALPLTKSIFIYKHC